MTANVRLFMIIALGLIAVSGAYAFQGNGSGGVQGNANAAYAIGLWGDLPYSDLQASVGVPNIIADMNSQDLAFTAHDGDLKAGSGLPHCDDALYIQALGYFNSLKSPAIFTPGDNDWTDCDRLANGGFLSLERLSHERQVFFQHTLHARATGFFAGSTIHALVPGSEGGRHKILRGLRREP